MLVELDILLPSQPPILWSDKLGAKSLACNSVFHARTKHIELDVHFFRNLIFEQKLEVSYVPTESQPADLLTKALPLARFQFLCAKLAMATPMSNLRGPVEDIVAGHLTELHSYKRSSSPATKTGSETNFRISTINSRELHEFAAINLYNKPLLDSSLGCINTVLPSI